MLYVRLYLDAMGTKNASGSASEGLGSEARVGQRPSKPRLRNVNERLNGL